jgi:hypothetical protein
MAKILAGNIIIITANFHIHTGTVVNPDAVKIDIKNGTNVVKTGNMINNAGVWEYEVNTLGMTPAKYDYYIQSTGNIQAAGVGNFTVF